jgi:ubiquinone/menaquinone biosynthesis C-methylase UbiE
MPAGDTEELFDQPALRRAELISRFVAGPMRPIVASAAPGFPQLLPLMRRTAERSPVGLCLDLGAGLGGISQLWSEVAHRTVISMDPARGSTVGARALFQSLLTVQASADALPVRSSSIAAVAVVGVTSLMSALDELAAELQRVLKPAGCVCIIDLVANGRTTITASPNWFRPLDGIEREMGPMFEVVDRAFAEPESGSWTRAGEPITQRIVRTCRSEHWFDTWQADQDHLAGFLSSGDVLIGATVMRSVGEHPSATVRLSPSPCG